MTLRAVHAHSSRARGLASRPITRSGAYTLDAGNGAGTREVLGDHLLGLIDHLVEIDTLQGSALSPFPETLVDDTGGTHRVTAPDTFAASGVLRGGGLLSVSWWDRDPEPGTRIILHGTAGTAVLETAPGVSPGANQPQIAPLRLSVTTAGGERHVTEATPSSLPVSARNVVATYRRFLDDVRNGTRGSAGFSDAAHLHGLLDAGVPSRLAALGQD